MRVEMIVSNRQERTKDISVHDTHEKAIGFLRTQFVEFPGTDTAFLEWLRRQHGYRISFRAV